MKNNFNNKPKISVITPSYNMGKYIEDNIKSVLIQSYKNFEHIIVDGVSNDDTLNILKKYPHLKWISEPDEGQSDAYNKALKMAVGDLVLCLNADDYLLNEHVFNNVIGEINNCDNNKYSAFMGNLDVVDVDCNKLSEMHNRNRDYSFDDLLNRLPVVIHPATFFKRDILLQVGGFAKDIHYVMDYDIFLKCAKVSPIHSINVYVSALRRHTASKGMSEENWRFSSEFIKLRIKYGGGIFDKINFQPYKNILYHLLGRNIVSFAKNSKIIYWAASKIGITKLKELIWEENEAKGKN